MQVRIGSRPSPLALRQAREAAVLLQKIYPGAVFKIVRILTAGDKDKLTPLSEVEGGDFFTREIDQALLKGEIDFGIHSSKDLPQVLPKGLSVALETSSLSPYDALVSKGDLKFKELPPGYRIGVSSQRRKEQIRDLRGDLVIVDVRGNIEERLGMLDTGSIDALIIAHAALLRLGLEYRIAEVLPLEIFPTHPKQGSLSLVAREEICAKVKFILSEQARATGN